MVEAIGNFLATDNATMLYWCAAIGGTLFFLVSLVFNSLELGGVDSPDVAADGTFDAAGHIDTGFMDFQLISIRSLLAFVTMFGWSGVVWGRYGWIGFILAFVVGFLAMYFTALLIHWMFKLQHSGTIHPSDLIGKNGIVYLTIPGGSGGSGKVTVSMPGSTMEISARSDAELKTGTPVRVVRRIEGSTYQVEKVG